MHFGIGKLGNLFKIEISLFFQGDLSAGTQNNDLAERNFPISQFQNFKMHLFSRYF